MISDNVKYRGKENLERKLREPLQPARSLFFHVDFGPCAHFAGIFLILEIIY